MSIDPNRLREAFGSFLTGVTIVTTVDGDGTPAGFTANSFTSVSLDPPLLLVCLGRTADCFDAFAAADKFAVNILAADQQDLSNLFAQENVEKFTGVGLRENPTGSPILRDSCAWFDCELERQLDGGDHIILLGRVRALGNEQCEPLGFFAGHYVAIAEA